MRRIIILVLIAGCCSLTHAQIKIGNKKLDSQKLLNAASNTVTAVTLTDEDVANMSREAVEWMDNNNPVSAPDSEYSQRLNGIVAKIAPIPGLDLNYKVYEVIDINAFACGDGSIRVFSSLMDIMTDDELAAIIGHEIGHVVNTDVKDAMKNAYLTAAAVETFGSTGQAASKLSDSQAGELTKAFLGSKFSRTQENAADDYAFDFCVKNGFDPYGMANALNKLVELSGGAKASAVQKMFSSHPDSAQRAERMKQKADKLAQQ